jgi:hypothetical protein
MDHGRVRQIGPASEIVHAYTASVHAGQNQAA